MSSSGIRVKRGERLPDRELSLEAGAKGGIRRSKGKGEAKALSASKEKSTVVPPEKCREDVDSRLTAHVGTAAQVAKTV